MIPSATEVLQLHGTHIENKREPMPTAAAARKKSDPRRYSGGRILARSTTVELKTLEMRFKDAVPSQRYFCRF